MIGRATRKISVGVMTQRIAVAARLGKRNYAGNGWTAQCPALARARR